MKTKYPPIPNEVLATLECLSVEELESLLADVNFELFSAALHCRKRKLNETFCRTPENIEKLLALDGKLVSCFEKMKTEASSIFETLTKRIDNKDDFLHDFYLEMKVTPFILVPDAEGKLVPPKDGIYQILMDNLPEYLLFTMIDDIKSLDYILCLNTSLNWNEDAALNWGLSRGELSEHYISDAIHELYDHTLLSIPDILRINHLWAEVTVYHQHLVDPF
jgi:hypothetical protein